jgi:hypothetical protein
MGPGRLCCPGMLSVRVLLCLGRHLGLFVVDDGTAFDQQPCYRKRTLLVIKLALVAQHAFRVYLRVDGKAVVEQMGKRLDEI